jgi:hypothetical protein
MTDIEPKEVFRQKAIDLINEYRQQRGLKPIDWLAIDNPEASAFIRSIQLHEATDLEFSGFKQLVSDAAEKAIKHIKDGRPAFAAGAIGVFVIPKPKPKPDPLVKVLNEISHEGGFDNFNHYAHRLRAALGAVGFEIREKNDD